MAAVTEAEEDVSAMRRSRPACPQDNPAHERMRRPLKAHTTRPPADHLGASANTLTITSYASTTRSIPTRSNSRSRTPAELGRPSARAYPSQPAKPSLSGSLRAASRAPGVLQMEEPTALHRQSARRRGPRPGGDRRWCVGYTTCSDHLLGRLDEHDGKVKPRSSVSKGVPGRYESTIH